MPCGGIYYWRWAFLQHIADGRERDIERCRLLGMKSPLSFAERKARRVAKTQERRA